MHPSFSLALSSAVLLVACTAPNSDDTGTVADTATESDTDTGDETVDTTDDVVEIAIRRLNDGQDLAAFEAARDAFVAQLREEPGVGTDREFAAFFDFGTYAEPTPSVYVGMTQYDDADAYAAAGAALGTSPEAAAFFATFTPELFTVVVPTQNGAPVDLAGVADGDGQVLEVAWRDLSAYSDFDMDAYAATRDAALAVIAAQDGVVAEYQWVAADGPIAVGMTVYESTDQFYAIASDPNFLADPAITAFFSQYPPEGGFVNTVVR